jgi:hypothetical protein
VHHSGLAWRTENKRYSVIDDVVEWSGLIPIWLDLLATVGIPHGHPDKPLITCFERPWELSDLEGAISRHPDAVGLIPHGHLDKPARLRNLGKSFVTRFECLGEKFNTGLC